MSARRSNGAPTKKSKEKGEAANIGRIHSNQEHSNIKSARKKTLIPKIREEKDEIIISRKGIANVFGKFYSKLYPNMQQDEDECTDGEVKTTYHTKLKASNETNKETDDKEAENEKAKEESESILNSQNKKCSLPLTASKKE